MQRGDPGLERIRSAPVQCLGATQRGTSGLDLRPVPERAILVGQQHDLAVAPACIPSRVVQQHQRQQAVHLRLVRHQLGQRDAQPDRLAGQLAAAVVARVEDQVDHGQHARQPVGKQVRRRYPEGDAGLLDLALGSDQSLSHGRLRDEEGAGDLVGS